MKKKQEKQQQEKQQQEKQQQEKQQQQYGLIKVKAYLGYQGYSIFKDTLSVDQQHAIRKELMVHAHIPKSPVQPAPFPVYRESLLKIYVPRYFGIERYGSNIENKISPGDKIALKFAGELRDYQNVIVDKFLKAATTHTANCGGGGLLDVDPGKGKTVMALKIIERLSVKTLVIVHKSFLTNQWKERIEQFLPGAKVGTIQGQIFDIDNKDIVIGMVQSLSMKEYPQNAFESFGLTVFDECFTYDTCIHTSRGVKPIGKLYELWNNGGCVDLPDILSYNQDTKVFQYKKMTHAWKKSREDLVKITASERVIRCTPEHKILTADNGYVKATALKCGDLLLSKCESKHKDLVSAALNEEHDQFQEKYIWNNAFENWGSIPITSIEREKNDCEHNSVYDIEVEDNHNFVIANSFHDTGGIVVSNCHHMGAEVFSRCMMKLMTTYTLGLSGTMQRKDGLSKVFKMFLGDVVHKEKAESEHCVLVKGIKYVIDDDEFNEVEYDYRGNPKFSTMISKLCNYNRRSEFIVEVIMKELQHNPEQQIMILAHNKTLLQFLFKAIEYKKIATVGYYLGGMKDADLKASESKKIIIATYAMASEGLDIKTLTTLVMATPKTDVCQSVGRILRAKHTTPLVIDIIDAHDLFINQWQKRKAYYKKQNYKIIVTENGLYCSDEKNGCWLTAYSPKPNKSILSLMNCDNDDEDEDVTKDVTVTNRKQPVLNGTCFL
jgi:superfamily II DNA or RNA helicase